MTSNKEIATQAISQHMERLHEVAFISAKYACSSLDKNGKNCREIAEDMADAYIGAMSRLIAAHERMAKSEAP